MAALDKLWQKALKTWGAGLAALSCSWAVPNDATADCGPDAVETRVIVHQADGSVSVLERHELESGPVSRDFSGFVRNVQRELPGALAETAECGEDGSPPVIALDFIYVPLWAEKFSPHSVEVEPLPAESCAWFWAVLGLCSAEGEPVRSGGCSLESPWLRLTYDPGRSPPYMATMIWSERQIIADQAVLAGYAPDQGPLLPVKPAEYDEMLKIYIERELLNFEKKSKPESLTSDDGLPAEFLWLFRRPFQTTYVPFDNLVSSEFSDEILPQVTPRQTSLTIDLAKLCRSQPAERGTQPSRRIIVRTVKDAIFAIYSPPYKVLTTR